MRKEKHMEKDKIKQLADYAISECTQHSENGKWSIPYEELRDRFRARIFSGNRNSRMLEEELRQREEINELIMTEDCIEMTCHLEYCENCQQGGIKGAMSLLSLMGCNLYDVHLDHESPDFEFQDVSSLNKNTLTEKGKEEWSDVLQAKVESIRPQADKLCVRLTDCDPFRVLAFTEMMNGQCDAEDYERWVQKNGISYASTQSISEEPLEKIYSADLVATYEELLAVPYEDNVTDYFGDYGLHYFRHGVTAEQIKPVYKKALAAMEMTDEEFRQVGYLHRSDIINRMRDCLLAKELRTGEKVLLITGKPYGGDENFAFRGGIVMAVDAEQKTCKIQGESFVMGNLPLHYILGRHDMSAGRHYGFDHVKPLFGNYLVMAHHHLENTEDIWNEKWKDGQEQEEESNPVLSM